MPESYQGATRDDPNRQTSSSQSVKAALPPGESAVTVGDILNEKGNLIHKVGPKASLGEAARLLRDHRIGVVLVLDEAGALKGILSERDVVRSLSDDGAEALSRRVGDVMTPDPVSCTPDQRIYAVLRRMSEGRFRHMPVMQGGKLVGLVSIGDVVKHRLRELEYEALKMRQMIVG